MQVTCTFDGTTIKQYINGSFENSETYAGSISYGMATNDDLHISNWGYGSYTRQFDGLIDEVRVSNSTRTEDWIRASYNSQNDPASYLTFGAEEDGPGGPLRGAVILVE